MSHGAKVRATTHPYPQWIRAVALFCLLLIGAVGTVEAVHIHGEWLPHKAAELHAPPVNPGLPGGEEHCPLCVAMHATLPVPMLTTPLPPMWATALPVERVVAGYESQWHFAMFSRPPPVAL